MVPRLRLSNAVRAAADAAVGGGAGDGLVTPGVELLLSNPLDPRMAALTLFGFAAAEPDGVWSIGPVARVEMRLGEVNASSRYRLAISAMPFEVQGHRGLVTLSVNGGPTVEVLRRAQGWQVIEVECPLEVKAGKAQLALEFHVANPMSPSALNLGGDTRALGFKLFSLHLMEVGESGGVDAAWVREEQAARPSRVGTGTLSQPSQLIRQLASRGPLWRKVLIDKNPLVRVVRWMRHLSRGIVSVQEQLELIRLDSVRRSSELVDQISRFESAREAGDRQQDDLRRLHEELQERMREDIAAVRFTQNEIASSLDALLHEVKRAQGQVPGPLEAELRRLADVQESLLSGLRGVSEAHERTTAQVAALITGAHEKLDGAGIAIAGLAEQQRIAAGLLASSRGVLRTSSGWIISTGFGHFSCDERDDLLAVYLAQYGDVERGLRLFLERVLQEGDVFVDVGANIGLHTIVAAGAVGASGRVFAVEAMPRTIEHLRASVRLSGVEDRVQILPVAAGARVEDGHRFHVGTVSGHSSLYPLEGAIAEVAVDIRPLDLLLESQPRVTLAKIDVEGAELDVVAGMRTLLQRNPGLALVMEFAVSHLQRVGTGAEEWEAMRRQNCFDLYLIDDMTGECQPIADFASLHGRASSNVLLCAPGSRVASQVTGGATAGPSA